MHALSVLAFFAYYDLYSAYYSVIYHLHILEYTVGTMMFVHDSPHCLFGAGFYTSQCLLKIYIIIIIVIININPRRARNM